MASSTPAVPSSSNPSERNNHTFLIELFDGTSGAFGPDDNRTIIQFLWRLLNVGPNSTANYVRGVATGGNQTFRGVRGFLGSGFDSKIVEGLRDIFAKWHSGVKIVVLGYSRGGVEACVVCNILSIVGIPEIQQLSKCPKDFAQVAYETYMAGNLDEQKESLEDEYKCQPVAVEALLVFDNVGTIGVPRTGVLRPLNFFKPQKNPGFDGRLRGDIRNAAHAIAFHESRKPYAPTLLYKSSRSSCNLVNMIFPGTHSHAGKQSATRNPIEDLYLAWGISVLRELGVPMREAILRQRFPAYRTGATVPDNQGLPGQNSDNSYAQGDISPRHSTIMKLGTLLLGQETRNPAKWLRSGLEANIQFHAAFQARDGVISAADTQLSAFAYKQDLTGGRYSDRSTFSTLGGSNEVSHVTSAQSSITFYPEAQLTPFEMSLHGVRGVHHSATL